MPLHVTRHIQNAIKEREGDREKTRNEARGCEMERQKWEKSEREQKRVGGGQENVLPITPTYGIVSTPAVEQTVYV